MIDINNVDSLNGTYNIQYDTDDYNDLSILVFNQIKNFENLGIDLLKNTSVDIKRKLFREIIQYADDNYLNIADIDNILISDIIVDEIGYFIYLFLGVDCFNSIFPNFIKIENINSFERFEKYIQINNYIDIKIKLLKSVKQIIDPLIKLQNLDPSVNQDIKYQAFLKRLVYEVDLIEYGDCQNFIENYMYPIFRKNFDDLAWRAL